MVDYLNNHDIYDTNNVRMDDRFDILVKVKSPQELPSIRNGLISFITCESLLVSKTTILGFISIIVFLANLRKTMYPSKVHTNTLLPLLPVVIAWYSFQPWVNWRACLLTIYRID